VVVSPSKSDSVEALVTRAQERAGLDDFGGDSWREGLQLLVDTCESAPGVNPGGREFVYGQFVDALWNRLRVVDYCKRRPELAEEQVHRPLVILGLPPEIATIPPDPSGPDDPDSYRFFH